ncbi:PDZ domain-containing protein [Neorhizobium galegae]|uniref:PDZ domain-containing protein n=1 Tax=Neorhizobium galegae TaxID=399 RepID=UPI0020C78FF9|nr:PDZ domain-containing protein [Neorhizobium galegae]
MIAGILMLSAAGIAPVAAQEIPNDFTAIVRQKIPAVVAITTRQVIEDQPTNDFLSPLDGRGPAPVHPQVREALRSGFVISKEVTPSIARALGIPDSKGASVASVDPGSPAGKADVQSGDVITRFNDRDIQPPVT